MKLKILAICSVCLLVLNTVSYGQIFSEGNGSKDNPYKIYDKTQLESLNTMLGEKYKNTHFILENDIDISAANWQPIGTYTSDQRKAFMGKFDGNGKKIIGMKIISEKQFLGLFGYLGSGAVVQNLSLESGMIEVTQNTGTCYIGGIAGRTNCNPVSGKDSICIINCNISVNIFVNTSTFSSYTGGVAGNADAMGNGKVIVNACVNYGNITSKNSELSRIGGIVGDCFGNAEITKCLNYGQLENAMNLGGIIGSFNGYGENPKNIAYNANCGNMKNISNSNTGGIVGIIMGIGSNSINLYDSYCHANITTSGENTNVGGIAGCLQNPSGNNADVNVYNTYFYGNLLSNQEKSNLGGIVGFIDNNSGKINIKNNINNFEDNEIKFNKDLFNTLNWDFSKVWKQYDLPCFVWQSNPVKIITLSRDNINVEVENNSDKIGVYADSFLKPVSIIQNIKKGQNEYPVTLTRVNVGENISLLNFEENKKPSYPVSGKITLKKIYVKADSKILCYGDSDAQLTYITEPALLPGEKLNGELKREPGSQVDDYKITQGTLNSKNYDIVFEGATYKILGILKITENLPPQTYIFPDTKELRLQIKHNDNYKVEYKWFKNGIEIPEAINPELIIKDPKKEDAGIYHIELTGKCNMSVSVRTKVEYDGNTNLKMETD